ncbi:glycoside hydrolase [Whalleya microplaca]|nr:glycoside hydrolase [Whalleya microplaca]
MQLTQSVLFAVCLAGFTGASKRCRAISAASVYQANAETSLDKLMTWYREDTGMWDTYGFARWWQSANILTTLIDMAQYGSPKAQEVADDVIPHTFAVAGSWNLENRGKREPEEAFVNEYYDDEAWWAIAWIKAFDATDNATYLRAAEDIFADLARGWGTNCSTGGEWWDKPHTQLNTISNTLFIEVGARLANRVQDRKVYYTDWAVRAWDWFREESGMYLPDQHLAAGGIDLQSCRPHEDPHSNTYSNGALIAGLVALSVATGQTEYLDEAHRVAGAVTTTMVKDGVLQEPHIIQSHPGESAPQFKGVFMRALTDLQVHSPRQEYKAFAQKTADSIWMNDRKDGALGPDYNGPFYEPPNASPHSSAMDAIVAAWRASQ